MMTTKSESQPTHWTVANGERHNHGIDVQPRGIVQPTHWTVENGERREG